VPAVYDSVEQRSKITEESLEWREILCETNTKPNTVRQLQTALKNQGFNVGTVDGVIGKQTLQAVRSYQMQRGLPTGGLTLTTLRSLGIVTS